MPDPGRDRRNALIGRGAILNVHSRVLPVPPEELGRILETLATRDDRIWRTELIEPITLSDGLQPGSRGGHGPVRYRVIAHEQGRRVRFAFSPGAGLRGWHEFEVVSRGQAAGEPPNSILRHTLRARPTVFGLVLWPLVVRPIHDAALEDMLAGLAARLGDRAAVPGTPAGVRLLARSFRRRVVRVDRPAVGRLRDERLTRIDACDSWSVHLTPRDDESPDAWVVAVLGRPPGWIRAAMSARDAIARRAHLRTLPPDPPETGFPVLRRYQDEIVLGVDDRHLDFRIGVRVDRKRVRVTTAVQLNNRLGRLYWAIVRLVHPLVVRSLLARARVPVRDDA